jgi:hypothetical protein
MLASTPHARSSQAVASKECPTHRRFRCQPFFQKIRGFLHFAVGVDRSARRFAPALFWSRHSLRLGGQHGEEGKGEEDGCQEGRQEEGRRQEEEEVNEVFDSTPEGVSMAKLKSHMPTTSKSGRRHAAANGSAGSSRRQRASAKRGYASRNLVVRTGIHVGPKLSLSDAPFSHVHVDPREGEQTRRTISGRTGTGRVSALPLASSIFAGRSHPRKSRRRPQ